MHCLSVLAHVHICNTAFEKIEQLKKKVNKENRKNKKQQKNNNKCKRFYMLIAYILYRAKVTLSSKQPVKNYSCEHCHFVRGSMKQEWRAALKKLVC